jgi:hypothetical protein
LSGGGWQQQQQAENIFSRRERFFWRQVAVRYLLTSNQRHNADCRIIAPQKTELTD